MTGSPAAPGRQVVHVHHLDAHLPAIGRQLREAADRIGTPS